MISGSIGELNKFDSVIEGALKIQQFVEQQEYKKLTPGEWLVLDDRLKVIFLLKDSFSKGIMETHQKFHDVHVTLNGVDTLHIAGSVRLSSYKAYDPSLDYELWQGEEEVTFKNVAGNFLFLSPDEAHNNRLDIGTNKLVFKIPVG